MTIGWAIVVVAVLYLLDKYHLLKKSLIGAGIASIVVAIGFYSWIGLSLLKGKWDNHQFAKVHECFDPSTGKTHPVNDSEPWCAVNEEVQALVPIPPGATIGRPVDDVQPAGPITPLYPAPDGSMGVPNPDSIPPAPDGSQGRRIICYNEETRKASDVPIKGGHADCKPPSIFMEEVNHP